MTRDLKLIIPAILIFILALFGIYRLYQVRVGQPKPSPIPSPIVSPSGFPTLPSPTPLISPPPPGQPDSGSNTVEVKNIGITVDSPQNGDLIASRVKVTGKANVFEGHVAIRIKDGNGNILAEGSATACMDVNACPFEALVHFPDPETPTGTVEAYSPSPMDGSEQYLQIVTVNFKN